MSPFMLTILLHYHSRLDEFSQTNTPAFADAINELVLKGLLKEREYMLPPGPAKPAFWELTERGKAFVTMILETPLPEACWMDPRTQSLVEVADA